MKIIKLKPGTFTTHGNKENPVESFPLGGEQGGYFISMGHSEESQQALEDAIKDLRKRFCTIVRVSRSA